MNGFFVAMNRFFVTKNCRLICPQPAGKDFSGKQVYHALLPVRPSAQHLTPIRFHVTFAHVEYQRYLLFPGIFRPVWVPS